MTLLEKLIFVFLCFAIAAGALIWIARIRQARISAQYRADFARPFGAGYLMPRPESDFVTSDAFNERMVEGLTAMRKTREWQGDPARIHQLTPEQRAAISSWSRGERGDDEVTEVAR